MFALALSLATESELAARFAGFHRVHGTEHAWPVGPATLELHNGHAARVVVRVDDQPVGELLPQQTGTLLRLTAGPHEVTWLLPSGAVRREVLDAG